MIKGVVTVFGVLAILLLVAVGSWALWWIGKTFIRQYERWRRQREIEQLQRMAEKKNEPK